MNVKENNYPRSKRNKIMTAKKGELYKVKDEPRYTGTLLESFGDASDRAVLEIKTVAVEVFRKEVILRKKSLPQILDEMDDNIRAVAEAARKAEEAARAAKQAAIDAHKASTEAEKRTDEALISGIKAAKIATKAANKTIAKFKKTKQDMHTLETSMQQHIESLEERISSIEASLPSKKVILLREISKKDAEKEIRGLFSKGKTLYYSDIAERLNLDLQLVVEICNRLQKRGEIEIDDNALHSR